MAFPVSPTEGQTYTENNTVWIYSAVTGQWNRSVINPLNETLYVFGSASATGAAGEIQYTDGSRLAASPNLVWDDVNDELEVGGDVVLDDGGTFTTTLQTVTPTQNRTISFPDATGTVGLVAGSSGQLVYNNAGAYAGVPSSVVGATGDITLALNGAASTPPLDVTGTWFTGGTSTTTKPQVLIEPAGATSTAWSTSGTGLGVNAASGFAGRLIDCQVNGSALFNVENSATSETRIFTSLVSVAGNIRQTGGGFSINGSSVGVRDSGTFDFWSGVAASPSVVDLRLFRDAAGTLAQRNGTAAQTFRVYNTYTSATNYELGKLEWASNVFRIGTEKGSGGGTARTVEVHTDSISRLALDTTGSVRVVTGLTVATLPGTPAVGMIARVTDASAPAMGAIVAGGGAAAALVWYNGTNWRVIGV
jgi:hypothetical protein